MKGIYLLIILSTLLFMFSCGEKNCESVEVGTIDLNENSIAFAPYQEDVNIEFSNEAGETMVFTTQLVNENYEICVRSLCRPLDPYAQTTCEYYRGQGIRNLLRASDESLLIELVASIENYETESKLFYDFFSVNMSAVGQLARGEYIPHVHFTNPTFEKEQSILKEELIARPTIELNGIIFQNVLHSEESNNMVYLQKEVGIVGLKLDGVIWVKN